MLTIEQYLTKLYDLHKRPIVAWDTEFNNTQEPIINLVCASLTIMQHPDMALKRIDVWLHNSPLDKERLAKTLLELRDNKAIFITFGGIAEGRAMEALGLDPSTFDVICLYSEWRQMKHNNNECSYGTYFTGGFKRTSVPPSFQKSHNKNKDNTEIGNSLVACVGLLFGVYIDSLRKTQMRDLILENKPEYTTSEQLDIMHYCADDVKYLPAIWYEQIQRIHKYTRNSFTNEQLIKVQIRRGAYTSALAKMESVGIPLDIEKAKNLRKNHAIAVESLIQELVKNYYPFYIKEKKTSEDFTGTWVDKASQFEKFIIEAGLYDVWPRTLNKTTGLYSNTLARDDKTLSKYKQIPELKAYADTKKQIGQLRWFREPDEKMIAKREDFFNSVGSDNRLRCFFGPFGTMTGRNAPPAKRFIFAMSSWLRCLIRPPKGYVIISKDYESQEFGIAAIKSKDKNMMAAYNSGDPYLFFAKKAKAVPEGANPKWCKNPSKAPEEVQELHVGYKKQRDLFKATTLGLQFGMYYKTLAIKLTMDMGREVTQQESKKLMNMHQNIYMTYWKWTKKFVSEHARNKVSVLWDGWYIAKDAIENELSLINSPIQGTGGVILRDVAVESQKNQIPFIALLHDGVYAICKEENVEKLGHLMDHYMDTSTRNILGPELPIRVETEYHRHDEPWVEGKGYKHYELLKKYLEPIEQKEDIKTELLNTIYR